VTPAPFFKNWIIWIAGGLLVLVVVGFGFVFLEALACGIPVVASSQDGGREATADGTMGILVHPANRPELVKAILA